jgi:hypothetical protein
MSSPIILPKLQQMEAEGSNLGVLALMQERALAQALAMREAKGFTAHTRAEVVGLADSNLPKGEPLTQLFLETRAGASRDPLADLQRAGHTLTLAAENLERAAARLQARGMSLPEFAKVQQSVGERYARIMEGAKTLEQCGVVPVHQSGKLAALSARPQGPLAGFYDKAVALMQQRSEQQQAPRVERMR